MLERWSWRVNEERKERTLENIFALGTSLALPRMFGKGPGKFRRQQISIGRVADS